MLSISADDYRDPAASLGNEASTRFGGRWTAAFAPVEDSEFVLMVQQRPKPPVVANAWILVTTLFVALMLVASAVQYHGPGRNTETQVPWHAPRRT